MFKYAIFTLGLFFFPTPAQAGLQLLLEAGQVWQERNDIEIPPEAGSRLEVDQFDSGPFFHYRAEIFYRQGKNHSFRGVYAPFQAELTGPISQNLIFDGTTFSSSESLTVNYKFNSYRLSYIYGFWGFDDDQLNFGFTGKVRDAEIKYQQNGRSEKYNNVGFVPLVYFEYQKSLDSNWLFNFNTDVAAASQGRAIDVSIKIRRKLGDFMQIGMGGRTLEGGADNEKVFTFSWFNYAVADLILEF